MSQPQREYEVGLPIGLAGADGARIRRGTIRKMRGHEEALLYDRDLGLGELVSQLIAGTLIRLGEKENPGVDVAARMYSADRNYLLLQMRRLTLGDSMSGSYTCPGCEREVRTVERLSEIRIREIAEDADPESVQVELEDGYRDRHGADHRHVTVRLPRGDDEAFVSTVMDRDPFKAADALTLRCIRSFGTLATTELQSYGLRILRDLSLGDRMRIQRALNDDAPGACFRRAIRCDGCGIRFERLLDVSDFFVPCWVEDTASEKRSSTWHTTYTGAGARS
jgi:hypothetical protein